MSSAIGLRSLSILTLVLGVSGLSACAGDSGGSGSRQGDIGAANAGDGAAAGTGEGAAGGSDGFDNSDTGAPPVMTPIETPDQGQGDECPSVARTTEPELGPVDIVWTIDGSGSMVDEAERLQNNMDSFVATISDAGVDTRVVLLAQQDLVPGASALAQSGNYLFVPAPVDSHNALDLLVAQFEDYRSFLRPGAHVHFIVVSDDESRYQALATPQDRAAGFRSAMDAVLDAEFTMHAVASPGGVGDLPCTPESVTQDVIDCCWQCLFICFDAPPVGCEQHLDAYGYPLINPVNCAFLGGAASPGVTYYTLADDTGGVATSICAEDWTNVFGSLSDAVIASAPLPCNYDIPSPPPGMTFERDKVNVRYTQTGMNPDDVMPFPHVQSADACSDRTAWRFDDPDAPSQVLLCPAACDAVSDESGGTMEIVFGCQTLVVE